MNWQSSATAPKDGRWFLAFTDFEVVYPGRESKDGVPGKFYEVLSWDKRHAVFYTPDYAAAAANPGFDLWTEIEQPA